MVIQSSTVALFCTGKGDLIRDGSMPRSEFIEPHAQREGPACARTGVLSPISVDRSKRFAILMEPPGRELKLALQVKGGSGLILYPVNI